MTDIVSPQTAAPLWHLTIWGSREGIAQIIVGPKLSFVLFCSVALMFAAF